MNFKILIFIFIVVNISNVHAYDNSVVTNIYSQVAKLYEGHKIHWKSVSAFSRFVGVRGGGVKNELFDEEMSKFTNEDLATKMNDVINFIQNEISRIKKIPAVKTMTVTKGQEINLTDIDKEIYQLNIIRNVDADIIGNTVIFNEEGTAKIFYYVYPKQINIDTEDCTLFLSKIILQFYLIQQEVLQVKVYHKYLYHNL